MLTLGYNRILLQDMFRGNETGPAFDSMPVRGVICKKATLPYHIAQLPRDRGRLNMVHQIPELGVVLVGNQAGRVIVLSLTKWQPDASDQTKWPKFRGVDTTSGFKIVASLPSYDAERLRWRPSVPLLGIAVSPVPGDAMTDVGVRRYRLLMTYLDNTILSYEIKRCMQGMPELVV